ncbi:MAG: GNAT family N-acetyltransferase [Desulfohalobiaceae bacterium]|nr:GNAT family N-acetyltransferase [Desulfohalobiaceae bacterium]
MPFFIEQLGKRHDRSFFSSGFHELDSYLQKQAGQEARRYIAAPYVLCESGGSTVIGFYTLSSISILIEDLPKSMTKKLPRYPVVPAVLIGRLAIDFRYQRQRLGEYLLLDSLYRCHRQAHKIAAAAVVVEAIDQKAKQFYQRYGFIDFPEHSNRMFIPMKIVEKLFNP